MLTRRINELIRTEALPPEANLLGEVEGAAVRIPASRVGAVKTVNGLEPDEGGNVEVDVSAALNDALAQAKASGEFDGKDGIDGKDGYTPVKGVDYFDGEKGDKGDPGEKGADGTKGEKGDKGDQGEQGIQGEKGEPGEKGDKGDKGDTGAPGTNGKDGTSVTVSSVSESTASGGTNIVTFSDGKTVTIKNGINGTNGTNGKDGADGKTPVKGTDYYTEADKAEMVNRVISALPTWNGGSY